jgi:hypothetical protein
MTPAKPAALLDFIESRIESLLVRPGLWGSDEAVEMQLLQLLEVRFLATSASLVDEVHQVQDRYIRFLRERFPEEPPEALSGILSRLGRSDELANLLREFERSEASRLHLLREGVPGVGLLKDDPNDHDPSRAPRHAEMH